MFAFFQPHSCETFFFSEKLDLKLGNEISQRWYMLPRVCGRILKPCPGNGAGRFRIFAVPSSQLFLEWRRKDIFVKDNLAAVKKILAYCGTYNHW